MKAYLLSISKAIFFLWFLSFAQTGFGQVEQVKHRLLKAGEIPVDSPGNYGKPGATYVLTKDIRSVTSALFLGKDVTLDLNGYTVYFADGPYQSIPNGGFEAGLKHWDLSKAKGAKLENTKDTRVFVGDKLLRLEKGDEVVSDFVYLPVGDRSYYAICGITGHVYEDMEGDLDNEMKISLFVENEKGETVQVTSNYAGESLVSSPVINKSPRLGGGGIVAHLNGLEAGKYRIRIKAETACLIDEVDISPAFDVGIGIVERTYAKGHFDHFYKYDRSAFFDYTADPDSGTPITGIPEVVGRGTVTIKNGTIKSGSKGIMTWGIQSTADQVKIILDNVKVINKGINATALDLPQANITHCAFEVDNPFLVHRHESNHYAVDLRGPEASNVAYSEFYGGQGCLVFKGKHSSIHHNQFVNRQMVTNHYSIMAMGDSSLIFENDIIPETGSGIEIFRHKGIEIFNNRIKVAASPPTTEYGKGTYSVAAIRIADYLAAPGAVNGAYGNKVYNNSIHVTGRFFPEHPEYTPMAWGVFYSASGGENFIFQNQITVDHQGVNTQAEAAAFYICGGPEGYGGDFSSNTIRSNVPAAWVATRYGGTANTKIIKNTFINTGKENTPPIRMGWETCNSCYAKDVVFDANISEGSDFSIDQTDQEHSYKIFWMLKVIATGNEDLKGKVIEVLDVDGQLVEEGHLDADGKWEGSLLGKSVDNRNFSDWQTYQIRIGNEHRAIEMNKNMALHFDLIN
jgi:hypothetical protein